MDVWGLARVSGQGCERYFLLVVDDYTRYNTVFPLRSKGQVPHVLIPWIRAVRLQLRKRFRQDPPVLRLHSDRGGEFSSDLLQDFCHWECTLQSFTLLDSPQQNGIAERRIGVVMEVARTSMIHAAAPHFMWPFAVRYAAHQLNIWPRVSLPETLPTLRWTGKVGEASVFPVWGSRAFFRDTSADKLFPYSSAPPPPPPLFLAPGPPLVDPLPPQGPAPSGVSQVDPLPGTVPVEVAIDSGATRGAASGGAASWGVEPRGAEPWGVEPGGAESEGAGSGGAEPGGVESGVAEPEGVEPGGAESRGIEPWGTASSGGCVGGSPRLSPRPEPLSPHKLREWLTQRSRLRSGATGTGDSAAGDTGAGGARVTAGAGGTGGAAAAGPKGARTKGTGAARTGSVWGAGAGDSTEPGAVGARGTGAGGTSAGVAGAGGGGAVSVGAEGTGTGGAGAGGAVAVDPRARGAGAGGAMSGGTGAGGTMRPQRNSFPCFSRFLVSCLLRALLLPYCVHTLTSRSR
ncbi:unnamed protein product [Closterium sp. NIES-53]